MSQIDVPRTDDDIRQMNTEARKQYIRQHSNGSQNYVIDSINEQELLFAALDCKEWSQKRLISLKNPEKLSLVQHYQIQAGSVDLSVSELEEFLGISSTLGQTAIPKIVKCFKSIAFVPEDILFVLLK